MGVMQAVMSSVVTIVVYALILAGVYKIFQVHTVLSEVRDLLGDIKRNTQRDLFVPPTGVPAVPPNFAAAYESPDQLIRALSAEPDENATRETPSHPQV